MNTGKTFRHGQILRLVTDARITNQEDLRRRLAAQKLPISTKIITRADQEAEVAS